MLCDDTPTGVGDNSLPGYDTNTVFDKPKHKPPSRAAAQTSRLRAHRSPLRYRCRLEAVVCENRLR